MPSPGASAAADIGSVGAGAAAAGRARRTPALGGLRSIILGPASPSTAAGPGATVGVARADAAAAMAGATSGAGVVVATVPEVLKGLLVEEDLVTSLQ